LNKGLLNKFGEVNPLTATIFVDDILDASVFKENTTELLAVVIKAIFLVCEEPDVAICQYPLSLEKWNELIVGPRQIVLRLILDKNKMTVRITDKYLQQVHELLNKWDSNKCMFKVGDMQKLVCKLARLGKGAP
jgi:hypothetical protein